MRRCDNCKERTARWSCNCNDSCGYEYCNKCKSGIENLNVVQYLERIPIEREVWMGII